jgi:hypothetical protein
MSQVIIILAIFFVLQEELGGLLLTCLCYKFLQDQIPSLINMPLRGNFFPNSPRTGLDKSFMDKAMKQRYIPKIRMMVFSLRNHSQGDPSISYAKNPQ